MHSLHCFIAADYNCCSFIATSGFPAKIACFLLFFALHLLVSRIIIITKVSKTILSIFILIYFFSQLEKTRVFFLPVHYSK